MGFPEIGDERAFCRDILPQNLLEASADWIRENVDPSDVFRQEDLESWAEENGYTKEDDDE